MIVYGENDSSYLINSKSYRFQIDIVLRKEFFSAYMTFLARKLCKIQIKKIFCTELNFTAYYDSA